jgi:phage/conjugal plasmid C-4 type zinc finger TraR family protein
MDGIGNRAFERAAALAEQEAAAGVAAASAALTGKGRDDCRDCGREIGAARRQALPSAERCVSCQGNFERGNQ